MRVRISAVLLILVALFSLSGISTEATLGYFTSITDLTPGCFPQGMKLESEPIDGIDWPKAHEQSLYGMLRLAEARYPVMIDRYDDAFDLYVDGDLTGNFERFAWERVLVDGTSLASVPFSIHYSDEQTSAYQVFVMWSQLTPTVITYCRDCYRAGEIQLGEVTYQLVLFDEDTDARYDDLDQGAFVIDADGDGHLLMTSDSHEIFSLAEPFNLAGAVYEVASVLQDGSRIDIVESDAYVEPRYPLLNGFPAPPFEGIDATGEPLSLESLSGEILVLDFWASWCSPCIYELPTMEHIADVFSGGGVRVIGINLDRSESTFTAALGTYDIGYDQIYDSDRGPIGDLYRIEGIPMTYIIDREGVIAARGLRGAALVTAIQELLDREE
jgi:thiol-disulfide isomerase/thioredoxin